jgi:hypothetical protein
VNRDSGIESTIRLRPEAMAGQDGGWLRRFTRPLVNRQTHNLGNKAQTVHNKHDRNPMTAILRFQRQTKNDTIKTTGVRTSPKLKNTTSQKPIKPNAAVKNTSQIQQAAVNTAK